MRIDHSSFICPWEYASSHWHWCVCYNWLSICNIKLNGLGKTEACLIDFLSALCCDDLSVHVMDCVCLCVAGDWLDREPWRGFPQQTHRSGQIPAQSQSPPETPWWLWGGGTGETTAVRLIQNHWTNPHQSYLSHLFSDWIIQVYPSKAAN